MASLVMKFLPSHKIFVPFQTAYSQKILVDITKGMVFSCALAFAPAIATAQVTDATRAKIIELQASDPTFKLKTFHRGCLDGSIQQAECESGLTAHMRIHATEARVAATEARVAATEARVAAMKKVGFDLDIVLSLLHTANYVALNLPFPDSGETIRKILGNSDTPKDVINILNTFKLRKDRGEKFDNNSDGKLILSTIDRHINSAGTEVQLLSPTNVLCEQNSKKVLTTHKLDIKRHSEHFLGNSFSMIIKIAGCSG